MVDLSIIIVNYKNPKRTNKCIDSIKKSDTQTLKYEIIIVDNASEDESKKIITKENKDVRYIQSKKNVGMGEGNNLGIKHAKGDYILITNDDIIFKKDAIRNLFNFFKKHDNIGIVGPRTFNSDGEVDWLRGSCFLTSKKVISKIGGGFDNRFWMYFEDIDLCRRVWENDLKVVYYFDAQVIHDHGKGSAKGRWYIAPFVNKLARAHIISWLKYFWKWKFKKFKK